MCFGVSALQGACKVQSWSWVWGLMPEIPALGGWRQGDKEFEGSLIYIVSLRLGLAM